MTVHIAEQETKIVQGEIDPSEVSYLPLDFIVEGYKLEIDAKKDVLKEVNDKIAEIEQQLHQQRLKLVYKREVMMIMDLEIDEASIEVVLCEGERLIEEELTHTQRGLIEIRDSIEASIEEVRITQIRHEEAIEQRLFASDTSN